MKELETLNPYASPSNPGDETNSSDGNQNLNSGMYPEFMRWTAICLLVAVAVLIVGVMMINVGGVGRSERTLQICGIFLLLLSAGLCVFGPVAAFRYSRNSKTT